MTIKDPMGLSAKRELIDGEYSLRNRLPNCSIDELQTARRSRSFPSNVLTNRRPLSPTSRSGATLDPAQRPIATS